MMMVMMNMKKKMMMMVIIMIIMIHFFMMITMAILKNEKTEGKRLEEVGESRLRTESIQEACGKAPPHWLSVQPQPSNH